MNKSRLFAAAILAGGLVAAPASAVTLLGYYEFEGNYNSTGGSLGAAIPTQNVSEVNLIGGGFRGGGVDINDPAMSGGGNTGGSLNIPYNANPNESPTVTFGGWFNLQSNAGFPGVMAIDNGGWDRGIHLNTNNWGIASGGGSPTNGVAPAPTGQWTYVVGTFDKPGNTATLYVGNDVAGTQTTASASRADNGVNPGLTQIEIGRYDNQDLDALVDDAFVFQDALNADQVNAIRNLRLASGLDYNVLEATTLLNLFQAGSGTATINGTTWTNSAVTPGSPGQLTDLGGGMYELVLNRQGLGLVGRSAAGIPEPVTATALLGMLGVLGTRRRRRTA